MKRKSTICFFPCEACIGKELAVCTELCPPAEAYANQDYVGQREHCFSYVRDFKVGQVPDANIWENEEIPVTKELIEKIYFTFHVSIVEIARMVGKSHPYISKVIAKAKERRAKKQRCRPLNYHSI